MKKPGRSASGCHPFPPVYYTTTIASLNKCGMSWWQKLKDKLPVSGEVSSNCIPTTNYERRLWRDDDDHEDEQSGKEALDYGMRGKEEEE